MSYISHSEDDIRKMLQEIGVDSISELFRSIPETLKLSGPLKLPPALSEWELIDYMERISSGDGVNKSYLGGGIYNHYIPSIIPYLTSRSEFLTSYTPYQPEISQGTLQAQFEFQTYISYLLGMDYSNASMYDGATSFAEGVLLSSRVTKSNKVVVSRGINPNYLEVLKTYCFGAELEIIELELDSSGKTDFSKLPNLEDIASISVQSPNYYGVIEDQDKIRPLIGSYSTLFISVFTEILSFGLYKPPGDYGADIACGEGQSLGISKSYGGPSLGIFAFNQKYLRQVPGRLVGQTLDKNGKRCFSLTLATREQHIRRERATSNICSNQGLCVVSAIIYLSLLGSEGIKKLAKINFNNAEYLKKRIIEAGGRLKYTGETFNEFCVEFHQPERLKKLEELGVIPGYKIGNYYLIAVTEKFSRKDLDEYIDVIGGS